MYQFARTAITKYFGLGDLNKRNLFSYSLGARKSKIKIPMGLISSEASQLDSQMTTLFLPLFMVISLCTRTSSIFYFNEDDDLILT